jgi:hypothetical protein
MLDQNGGTMMKGEKQLLLTKLREMHSLVEIEVVLEDLTLLDSESAWWPRESRRRALAEGLHRRKFFATFDECLEMADLWMRLRLVFGLKHLHHTRMLFYEFCHQEEAKNASLHLNVVAMGA